MNTSLRALSDAGVSIWLDDLPRQRLATGNLAALVANYNVTGVTTNPTIFAAALDSRDHYTPQLSDLAAAGVDADQAIRTMTTDDVRAACDVLAEVYTATVGRDGRVSIEVDPRLAFDTDATVTNAINLWKTVERPNAMIKIPATEAGLPAITAVRGDAAIVNARLAYSTFTDVFGADRFTALAMRGANRQRPLWASTGVKDTSYPDTRYVTDLVAADTVNTMPEKALLAFADHGTCHGDQVSGSPPTTSR